MARVRAGTMAGCIVPRMKCLFLDIASHDGLIALVSEREVITHHDIHARISDRELVSFVEELLIKARWSYADLTHIACIIGPGGFMSLRVAVSFTNTIASQLRIPSVGIHLSDVYAARVSRDDVLWIHSTKKTEVFVRGFGAYQSIWPQPIHLSLHEAINAFPQDAFWIGELLPDHEKAMEERGFRRAVMRDTIEILPLFLAKQSYSQQNMVPWYGREW